MKLWLLKRKAHNHPLADTVNGFVVRARSAQEARGLAALQKMDEGANIWLDSQYSHCYNLQIRGQARVLLRDANVG